jgi:hypothetical protein
MIVELFEDSDGRSVIWPFQGLDAWSSYAPSWLRGRSGVRFQVCISMLRLLLVEDVNVPARSEGPMGMFAGEGMNA